MKALARMLDLIIVYLLFRGYNFNSFVLPTLEIGF